jgi:hypothetical protein
MNYQQKLKLIKGSEIVELEIDNQIVFIRRSSNNNQEETKILKSLEEAEAYFNKMKAEFEENGFVEQIGSAIEYPGDEQQPGENLIDLLNLVADNNPKVAKYFNQNKGSVPEQLADEVIEQIRRLGGKFRPKKKSKIVIDNFLAPEAIALWYTNSLIEFPRKTFATDEDNNNSYWVWDLCFEWSGSCKEFPAEDKEGKFLSIIAMADGGNYILAIDLNDPDPSNPKVYSMDHYDPEQCLGDGVRLSDFLTDLTEQL